jgi:hypothetical protein
MIDTGMNRLGLDANDVKADLFDGLEIETLMSHLACADEDGHQLNMVQPMIFRQMASNMGDCDPSARIPCPGISPAIQQHWPEATSPRLNGENPRGRVSPRGSPLSSWR